MKREQLTIMFSTLVLVIVILCGAVIALSAKYNELEAENDALVTAYIECEAGTP